MRYPTDVVRTLRLIALSLCVAPLVTAEDGAVTPRNPLYLKHCAMCHEGGVPRAPHSITFSMIGSGAVYRAMTEGPMVAQAAALSDEEKRELAEALGGSRLADTVALPANCAGDAARFDMGRAALPADWGMSPGNARYVSNEAAGIDRASVAGLTLKWAFGIPGVSQARSQPTVAGGALFTGTQTGSVYALDLETGCVRWRYEAGAEVRNAPVVHDFLVGGQPRLFFGDLAGNVHAVNALTGESLWRAEADPHPAAVITGNPRVFEDRLVVPVSSSEWASAADPAYPCCTFQGGVLALSLADGRVLWKARVFDEMPSPNGRLNDAGAALNSPAGAPVWGTPAVDAERRRVYLGTGEDYTSPATDRSDAVFAFDLDTGERLWHYQSISGDAWNMACFIGGGPNCPEENGPDLDIGAAPLLVQQPGQPDRLIIGQKSGHLFALNPDNGHPLWRKRLARGGFTGGVHWGMAFNGERLFVPIADTVYSVEESPGNPGLYSVDPTDGSTEWYTWSESACTADSHPGCDRALSAPITATDDLIFAGAFDGTLRAYGATDGKLLWRFDTVQTFQGVNGTTAVGGTIEAAGPVVSGGYLITNSGYAFGARMPGNALLVFSVDGK